jgi:ABC-type Na+ transport system ATPase subunit NatA
LIRGFEGDYGSTDDEEEDSEEEAYEEDDLDDLIQEEEHEYFGVLHQLKRECEKEKFPIDMKKMLELGKCMKHEEMESKQC